LADGNEGSCGLYTLRAGFLPLRGEIKRGETFKTELKEVEE
jgi:hypothetical protein